MAKDVMISSVGPGGKRTPVSIHRMNGKIKTIWTKKGGSRGRKKKSPKVRVYKVETLQGPIWRTAITDGAKTLTYDTKAKSGKTYKRIQIGSMMSAKLKKLATSLKFEDPRYGQWIKEAGLAPVAFTDVDVTQAVSRRGLIYHFGGVPSRKAQKTFYDKTAAEAFAKSEYETALADYKAQWGVFGAPLKSRWQRKQAPKALTQRGQQKRLIRGGGRQAGLSGKKQREARAMKRSYKSFQSAEKQRLQRYKEDIESYRETWGL